MRLPDPAHLETDRIIQRVQKDLTAEYAKAQKELTKKWRDYLRRYEAKDEKWREWVRAGTKSKAEYLDWRKGQIMMGRRWEKMKDTLAQDYVNVHKIAEGIVRDKMPDVYAINHNYGTYEIEKGALVDTSYTLYNHDAVARLVRDNPELYGRPGSRVMEDIRNGLLKEWDKKQIQSVMLQGIMQGDSIPDLEKRLRSVTGGNRKAAIRNARTMMTGCQSAGRLDSYRRANKLGIPTRKQWIAALDTRTRHWHRQLDGVVKEVDEKFENEMGKIMFPGDPSASGSNIYNCRCTLLSVIKGFELDLADPSVRPNKSLKDMTYDEWKAQKESTSRPITYQEDLGNAIRGAWNKKYRGG